MPDGDYAGDILAAKAFEALSKNEHAVLVDVRTQIEWTLIGKPDLAGINKEPVFLQWLSSDGINQEFLPELEAELAERGVARDAPLYFMCQSGGRSKMAAMQMTGRGYTACYNVVDGFEGELDEHRHRNSINGWKASGLPWFQT